MEMRNQQEAMKVVQKQESSSGLAAGAQGWSRRLMLPALLACAAFSTNSYALLMSQDSSYGTGSITVDTDTGLQWLDPWLPIIQGVNGCGAGCTSGSTLNSFNNIKSMMGSGGYFEGFRYATASEIQVLLYSSAGINAATSGSASTATSGDIMGIANLISVFDTTYELGFGPDRYMNILNAVYDDGAGGADMAKLTYSRSGPNESASVQFDLDPNLSSNTDPFPYGHWLVSDINITSSSVNVDEPQGLLLLGIALAAAFGFAGRKRSTQAIVAA